MAAHIGRHLRRGAATTAVAAVAVAALTASQAPGVAERPRSETGDSQPIPDPAELPGDDSYYTDLPQLKSPAGGKAESAIPATVLDAYKKAEATLRQTRSGCNLPWELLAAIGQVESGQARGGKVDSTGTTPPDKLIIGPPLNGKGFAHISDTDNGAFDNDTKYDHAVGPMQFIPSTWAWAGKDGNEDGKKDPNNVYDAALAAGYYLCRYEWDLSDKADLERAILSYNNSRDYLNTVLRWMETFRDGVQEIPDGTGSVPVHRNDDPLFVTPNSPSAPPSSGPGGGTNVGGGSGGGNGSGTPGGGSTTPPTPPPTTPPAPGEPATPTDRVHHLEHATGASLSTMAGTTFGEGVAARAETSAGVGVGTVRIRFTIVGDTDTVFTGGEDVATVQTDSRGVATAPALVAGERTGAFTVRATVVGRDVTAVEWEAAVTVRTADKIALVEGEPLVCAVGGKFDEAALTFSATRNGAPAAKVGATVTLVKAADDLTQNDKGPYFEDADGKAVRTLALTTDADGVLELPTLFAGDTAGTYLLLVETPGGGKETVELTVDAAGEATAGEAAGTA
ncbi:lytic transglycosylase domain-containing protein [Streptomyces sp. NPDC056600]|uniref:lytic transglycosylase domain-containing protein n=1 Tax=Streptomyces sp. NPDC056600 TaxID=3345874 RepID=UPI0036946936